MLSLSFILVLCIFVRVNVCVHLCVCVSVSVSAPYVITNTIWALSVDCRENTINLCYWASHLLKEESREGRGGGWCQEITATVVSHWELPATTAVMYCRPLSSSAWGCVSGGLFLLPQNVAGLKSQVNSASFRVASLSELSATCNFQRLASNKYVAVFSMFCLSCFCYLSYRFHLFLCNFIGKLYW